MADGISSRLPRSLSNERGLVLVEKNVSLRQECVTRLEVPVKAPGEPRQLETPRCHQYKQDSRLARTNDNLFRHIPTRLRESRDKDPQCPQLDA